MPSRASIAAAAVAATLWAAPGRAASPPTRDRLPMQSDFDRCALAAADNGSPHLQGRIRLELLIRQSGNVYAAFVYSADGITDRRLGRCLTSGALLWKLPAVPVDYSRAYQLTFVPGGTEIDFSNDTYWSGQHFASAGRASVFMPDINDAPPPAQFDEQFAQTTLEIADWATGAEEGIAQLAVRRYPDAIKSLRQALEQEPNDPVALRGLAQALADSGGDLGEARAAAELLVAAHPDSAASHEALLRVCVAANDDLCTFRSFKAASKAADVGPRSRRLSELQPAAEGAAARLRDAAMAMRKADPCAAEKTEADQLMCVVRRCLDAGTVEYAQELAGQPAPWKVKALGEGRMLVTRPIQNATRAARERQDPAWMVRAGARTIRMAPVNSEARHVTVGHSRCGAVDSRQIAMEDIEQPRVAQDKAKQP